MTSTQLHPDFPAFEEGVGRWDLPDPLEDISVALDAAAGERRVSLSEVASITDYSIASDNGFWSPTNTQVATELSLYVVGTLKSGEWFALEGWNDYTGWGCQDGADIYVGPTREDVLTNGVTNDGRSALGLS